MAQEAGEKVLLTTTRGPWTGGYTSSVPGFMARPDQLIGNTDGSDTNSSRDCVIDPFTGGVSKRTGVTIQADTVSSQVEVTGILNSKWGAKCRKLFALDSPSLTNGYPTYAALFGEDTNANFPTGDDGFHGTLLLRSTNNTATTNARRNYSLLEDFVNSSTYSRSLAKVAATDYMMRVVPIWMESGDGVYFRGNAIGTAGTDQFMQQFLTAGSRSLLQTQNWLYAPNLRCTPWRWNKVFNNDNGTASTTNVVRIFPTGPFPPLYPPTVTTPSSSTTGTSWSDGDTFYLSVIFVFEDGSPSAPFIPRQPNAVLTGGNGLATVGTIGNSAKYQYITYSNIPIGPQGTIKRVLLRTVKQNRTATTDNITVAPLDLRVIGVLNNNTQTSFLDYGGDDDSLLEDDDFVDVDWTVPRRSRFIGTGDSRAIISYTLPNTAAIMLAPVAINTTNPNDLNTSDGGNIFAAHASYIRITSTDLELHYSDGSTAPVYDTAPTMFGTALGTAVKFPFATYTTVEAMVDAINLTLTTSNCKMWKAQLAPGIDPTMPTDSLTKTTFTINSVMTDTSTTVTSAALFGSLGIGMKVSGAGITAGTYIVSKTSASSITLSNAYSGVSGTVSLTYYQDTGDTESVSGALGFIRAFCPAWPVLLHMKPSAFPDYATPDKASVYFTNASPGAASSGISLAPNSFNSQNRRLPHSSPRQSHPRTCVGIVDIEGAAIIAYSDGIYTFVNQRGANTGEDFDCRLFTVNDTRGCISYLGLTSGNGWAAYATTEGIVVTDKNRREFVISGDIYNPTDLTGDLAYEIQTSAASVASDSDDQYLGLAVIGSRLYASMRESTNQLPRVLHYDFSPGVEASGVEELLSPDTRSAYIWSPPHVYNSPTALVKIGAMGSVRGTARRDYVSFDSNLGATGDGRIDLLDTSVFADNLASELFSYAVMPPVVANPFMSLSMQDVEVTHRTTTSPATSSQLAFATDQVPTFNTSALVRTLEEDNGKQYQKQVVPVDQGQRGKTDAFWAMWYSNAVPGIGILDRIWRIVFRYSEVEN